MSVSDNRTNSSTPYDTNPSSSTARHGEELHQGEEIKNKAKQTSEELKEEARRRVTSAMEQQKRMAADQTDKLAIALQHMADELDEQQHYFSGCVNNLARCTDTLSQRLRERDIHTLVSQVQDYTRRQPSLLIGGAIVAGFLFARFMRSSPEHEQH